VLALIASYVLVAFFFVPAALFRWQPRSILQKIQRTRTEEITFAVTASVIPLVLSFICLDLFSHWNVLPGNWTDYREIFAASYSDEFFRATQDKFWASLGRVSCGQIRLLLLLWPLALLEGYIFLVLVRNYGRWHDLPSPNLLMKWRLRFVKWLLDGVSKWHVLLTPFNFVPDEHTVAADLLTVEDHLYQGHVRDYFLDKDGELSGILLDKPRRFDRRGFVAAKEKDPNTSVESFWREIPTGTFDGNLYLPADKMLSMNVRYPFTEYGAAKVAASATEELADMRVPLRVEPEPLPQKTSEATQSTPYQQSESPSTNKPK
jgi:hypothetical protein